MRLNLFLSEKFFQVGIVEVIRICNNIQFLLDTAEVINSRDALPPSPQIRANHKSRAFELIGWNCNFNVT